MTARKYCLAGLVLYAGLSVTDFALTYALVTEGVAYEANPVAAAWLHRYGWAGLAWFKALGAAVFAVPAVLVARRRPRTGALLVTLGCLVMVWVVVYSNGLLAQAAQPPRPE
jgi:hypothetical protein